MSSKTVYYFAAIAGSIIGSYLPVLWGGSLLSLTSIAFSTVGGVAGILLVWNMRH